MTPYGLSQGRVVVAAQRHRQHTHTHAYTHTNKLKEKKNDAPPRKCPGGSLMRTLANSQTFVFASVAVPAEDHRGPGPADGGRSAVHLQLRERRPAQPLLRHSGMSAAAGLRVRSRARAHTHHSGRGGCVLLHYWSVRIKDC